MRLYALYYPVLLNKALSTTSKELGVKISPQLSYLIVAIYVLYKRKRPITYRQCLVFLLGCGIAINRAYVYILLEKLEKLGYVNKESGKVKRFECCIYSVEPGMLIFINTLEKKLRAARLWTEKESNWHKWNKKKGK